MTSHPLISPVARLINDYSPNSEFPCCAFIRSTVNLQSLIKYLPVARLFPLYYSPNRRNSENIGFFGIFVRLSSVVCCCVKTPLKGVLRQHNSSADAPRDIGQSKVTQFHLKLKGVKSWA